MEAILEVCCGDIASVEQARLGGASRVELCSALGVGGLTPSEGFVKAALAVAEGMRVHVLIRHREGDFVYTPQEISVMCDDIRTMQRLGAHGVVIGALTPDGDIDCEACSAMMDAAEGMSVTFSRAFDLCRNGEKALEDIIALGCDRLLTSGMRDSAINGVDTLKKLNAQSAGRITLLAGSGINSENAPIVMRESGITEVHASARHAIDSSMVWRSPDVSMGTPGSDEYTRKTTSSDEVNKIVNNITNSQI